MKSRLVVTSIDQTIEGKKVFENIEVPAAVKDTQATNKKYVDDQMSGLKTEQTNFVKKSGDTMTGPLIVPKDSHPVQGDLNKVISYEVQREIFLSKKEGGQMSQLIDMNNNFMENLKTPTENDHAVNKNYVDAKISGIKIPPSVDVSPYLKIDGTTDMQGNLDMGGNKIENVGTPLSHENDAAVNVMLFNRELNPFIANVVKTITNQYKKYVDDSHVSPSGSQKDVFRYLMEDADQSSSENNIQVIGIELILPIAHI